MASREQSVQGIGGILYLPTEQKSLLQSNEVDLLQD